MFFLFSGCLHDEYTAMGFYVGAFVSLDEAKAHLKYGEDWAEILQVDKHDGGLKVVSEYWIPGLPDCQNGWSV